MVSRWQLLPCSAGHTEASVPCPRAGGFHSDCFLPSPLEEAFILIWSGIFWLTQLLTQWLYLPGFGVLWWLWSFLPPRTNICNSSECCLNRHFLNHQYESRARARAEIQRWRPVSAFKEFTSNTGDTRYIIEHGCVQYFCHLGSVSWGEPR